MNTQAKKHYDAMKRHLEAGNDEEAFVELERAYRSDPQSVRLNFECGELAVESEEWQAGFNYLSLAISYNNQRIELQTLELIGAFKLIGECSAGLGDNNLAQAFLSVAFSFFTQNYKQEDDEELYEEIMDAIMDAMSEIDGEDESIVNKYLEVMQTSFPMPHSITG